MHKIEDTRTDPEAKKRILTQENADDISNTFYHMVYEAENRPGAWIKRWGSRWENLKDLTSENFQGNAIRWLNFLREKGCRFPHENSTNAKLKKEFMQKLQNKENGHG
jgi:hypothetical protein